jgi:hypothetical protein
VIDVSRETGGFVLRDDLDAPEVAVHAIGEYEIDDPVLTAERNTRLGTISREGFEARSPPTRENHREDILHIAVPLRP